MRRAISKASGCLLALLTDAIATCASADDKTISGLSVILGKLVDKGKLELVAGQYQLSTQ